MSGFSFGPRGGGYRANCRCTDLKCRKTITVFPDDAVIEFAGQKGEVYVFHLGAEEANALAADLQQAAKNATE